MKMNRILGFSIAVLISQFALAKVTPYTNEVFGSWKAPWISARKLDAPSAAKYLPPATEDTLAKGRDGSRACARPANRT